jgi:L-iditol 2-dehydrogenase
MIEPLACATHAVQRAGIELQDTVALAGLGPLGQCMAQVAGLQNPKRLILLDLREDRLELATRLSGGFSINVKKQDAVKIVREMTNGAGCDKYIEATGHPEGITQGIEMIRKQGTFVVFGTFSHETTVDWTIIGDQKELDIHGSHISPYTYPLAIDFINRGKVKTEELVTHAYPIDDFKTAFEIASKGEAIKVILVP